MWLTAFSLARADGDGDIQGRIDEFIRSKNEDDKKLEDEKVKQRNEERIAKDKARRAKKAEAEANRRKKGE